MMQEVVDQINKCVLAQLENVHTAVPGEIKEYDPDKGIATVQPKAKFKSQMEPCWTTRKYLVFRLFSRKVKKSPLHGL